MSHDQSRSSEAQPKRVAGENARLVMDDDWLRDFVAAVEWTFAKTMPESPHWYALRKRVSDQAAFDRVVMEIRRFGFVRKYRGSRYTCYELDGMIYWTMGWPLHNARCPQEGDAELCHRLNCTFVLNRAVSA